MKNDKLNALFDKFQGQWDSNELSDDHENLFLEKLNRKKPKSKLWFPISIAATVLISIGVFFLMNNEEKPNDLEFASSETREINSAFNAVINSQLVEIKENNSPENQKIIDDALRQMKRFEADYEIIKKELETNGENKQIIVAMISNLQTQLNFLKDVLKEIENNKNFKEMHHEKTM
jgi:hypothetical protein